MSFPALPQSDVVVIGAGIMGIAVALEVRARGARVVVLERDTMLSHASSAAAGMLAVNDPYNSPELLGLSHYSISVYDDFLRSVEGASELTVPYQTEVTNQYREEGEATRLAERSLDPRQLAHALRLAVQNLAIDVQEHWLGGMPSYRGQVVRTTGAWTADQHVTPRKGQMLRVQIPWGKDLDEVHRAEHVYAVPRLKGPQAGTVLIGATVENAGFDLQTHPEDLKKLRCAATRLNAQLDFLADAPVVEAWAGLRPSTPDGLPVIGRVSERELVATGHFRNGILLAPGTAKTIADLLERREPAIDLNAFRPGRFA